MSPQRLKSFVWCSGVAVVVVIDAKVHRIRQFVPSYMWVCVCILSYNQIKNTASPDVFLMAARTTCSLSLSLAQHNMKLAKEEGATKVLCDYQSGASCPHSLTCGYLANVVVDALIYNTAQYCVLRLFSRLPRMCMCLCHWVWLGSGSTGETATLPHK